MTRGVAEGRGDSLSHERLPAYATAWSRGRVYRNASDGCHAPVDTQPRRWTPGTPENLDDYWKLVS